MKRAPRVRARSAAVLATAPMLSHACASTDDGGSGTAGRAERGRYTFGSVGKQPEGGKPARGGTLRFADYGEDRSLSPAVICATGASGGSALAAGHDAGPFTRGSHAPREEMVLKANKDDWKGAPHLGALRFTWPQSDRSTLAAPNDGSADVTCMRSPDVVDDAVGSASDLPAPA
ncbi:hypothetical protein ACFVW8_36515 [Streptomyces sp. NPDC058221]|uniref:hypothetical protein n=1 Tax=Streptomyces sp. NPDC058221 TaxID=3346388 RepID=UPI0036F076B3